MTSGFLTSRQYSVTYAHSVRAHDRSLATTPSLRVNKASPRRALIQRPAGDLVGHVRPKASTSWRPGRRGFDAAPPPCRLRLPSPRPPACTGSSAAGRRGSCSPPSRCGCRPRPAARPPSASPPPRRRTRGSRSAIGITRACTGASHVGKAPAKCSIRMPMNRSSEPMIARWIITGRLWLPSASDVGEVELLRELEVQLHRGALPHPAQGVGDVEVQLRPVEGAVARVDLVAAAPPSPGPGRARPRPGPTVSTLAHEVLGPGGKLDAVLHAQGRRRRRRRAPARRGSPARSGPPARRGGRRPGGSPAPASGRAACPRARSGRAGRTRRSAAAGPGRSGSAPCTAGSGWGSSSA